MRAEYDRSNNRIITIETEDGRKVSTNNPRILGAETEWLSVETQFPAGFTPRFGTLLNQQSAQYTYDPDRNMVVLSYPEADFSPGAVRVALVESVKGSARTLLSRTDWMVLRQVETGVPVPDEVKAQRDAVRQKADRFEAEIAQLDDSGLVDYTFTFTTAEPKAPVAPVEAVPGGDGTEWVTDATAPGQAGVPVEPVVDELDPENVTPVGSQTPDVTNKVSTGLPEVPRG